MHCIVHCTHIHRIRQYDFDTLQNVFLSDTHTQSEFNTRCTGPPPDLIVTLRFLQQQQQQQT